MTMILLITIISGTVTINKHINCIVKEVITTGCCVLMFSMMIIYKYGHFYSLQSMFLLRMMSNLTLTEH